MALVTSAISGEGEDTRRPGSFRGRAEENLPNLDLPARRARALARPRQRIVHIGAFQYPEATDMFLGFKVRTIGDEDFAVGLRAQRLGGAEPTRELPDAGVDHFLIERNELASDLGVRQPLLKEN